MKQLQLHTLLIVLLTNTSNSICPIVYGQQPNIASPQVEASPDKSESGKEAKDHQKYPPAPQPYESLVDVGKVSIELYDPENNPREFDGETHFKFSISYDYRYTYTTRINNGKKTVIVKPRFTKLDIDCSNHIYVPEKYQGDRFWTSRLVDHEFEHVRLNCDVRPKLLARNLLHDWRVFEIKLTEGKDFSRQLVDEEVQRYTTQVRTEIVRIIQAENDYLDELTKHGIRHLERFDEFFNQRYSKQALEKYEFKYLKQAREILKSKEYSREQPKTEDEN